MFGSLIRVLLEALAIALGCVIAFAVINQRFSAHGSLIVGLLIILFWLAGRIPTLVVASRAARLREQFPKLRDVGLLRFTESMRTVLITIIGEIVVLVVIANVL